MSDLRASALYLSFVLGVAILVAACGSGWSASKTSSERTEAAASVTGAHGIDEAAIDPSIVPGDDFFRYTNGIWLKKTAIPPDRSSYGVSSVLFDRAQQRTRELMVRAAASHAAAGSDERKIGDYFGTYMDEQAIEKKGLEPLRDTLNSIDAIVDKRMLASWIGQHLRADVDPLNMTNFHTDRLFGVWIAQNLNDPSHNVPYLLQGGLGLPDRDYYLQAGARMDSIRSAYRGHITNVFTLAGIDKPQERATAIFDLEHRIASAHATRTESVDVHKANNPWSHDEFSRRARGIDWDALLAGAHLDGSPTIIVWHPAALRGIAAIVQSVPLDVWRDYLKFHELDRYGGLLPKAFADESFAFYGKVLSGTPQQEERWKRAVNATNGALGEAVGKIIRAWLAFGITTVRSPGGMPYEAAEFREASDAGQLIGPRVFSTGYLLEWQRVYYPMAVPVSNVAQLEMELQRAKALQFDLIKSYVRMPELQQRRIVEFAHAMGVPSSSHEVYPAAFIGSDGTEHITGTSRRGFSPKVASLQRSYDDVAQLWGKAQMTMTPTLALGGATLRAVIASDSSVRSDPRLRLYALWNRSSATGESGAQQAGDAQGAGGGRRGGGGGGGGGRAGAGRGRGGAAADDTLGPGNLIMRTMRAGTRIVAGTDTPNAINLHAELAAYVAAGMTPFEALKTATVNPAVALNLDAGSIQGGKLADLAIVEGNPLQDINAARRVRRVIVNGRVYSVEELLAGPGQH